MMVLDKIIDTSQRGNGLPRRALKVGDGPSNWRLIKRIPGVSKSIKVLHETAASAPMSQGPTTIYHWESDLLLLLWKNTT